MRYWIYKSNKQLKFFQYYNPNYAGSRKEIIQAEYPQEASELLENRVAGATILTLQS